MAKARTLACRAANMTAMVQDLQDTVACITCNADCDVAQTQVHRTDYAASCNLSAKGRRSPSAAATATMTFTHAARVMLSLDQRRTCGAASRAPPKITCVVRRGAEAWQVAVSTVSQQPESA